MLWGTDHRFIAHIAYIKISWYCITCEQLRIFSSKVLFYKWVGYVLIISMRALAFSCFHKFCLLINVSDGADCVSLVLLIT